MLVRSILCHLPEDLHSKFKSKTLHNNLTMQDVLTKLIIAYTTTTELDRIAGIKK